MKQASLNKVKAMCGKQSALMDGTPIIIVEPWIEYRFETRKFCGRIKVKNEISDETEVLWFYEIADDFSPNWLSIINPLDTVVSFDDEIKASKIWNEIRQEISDIYKYWSIWFRG